MAACVVEGSPIVARFQDDRMLVEESHASVSAALARYVFTGRRNAYTPASFAELMRRQPVLTGEGVSFASSSRPFDTGEENAAALRACAAFLLEGAAGAARLQVAHSKDEEGMEAVAGCSLACGECAGEYVGICCTRDELDRCEAAWSERSFYGFALPSCAGENRSSLRSLVLEAGVRVGQPGGGVIIASCPAGHLADSREGHAANCAFATVLCSGGCSSAFPAGFRHYHTLLLVTAPGGVAAGEPLCADFGALEAERHHSPGGEEEHEHRASPDSLSGQLDEAIDAYEACERGLVRHPFPFLPTHHLTPSSPARAQRRRRRAHGAQLLALPAARLPPRRLLLRL